MKKNRTITLSVIALSTLLVISGFSKSTQSCKSSKTTVVKEEVQKQTVNMFVTHGHCSTSFGGVVDNLNIDLGPSRTDGGNPLENMKISFNIDPNTFMVCRGNELTEKIKTPGLFISEKNEMITFRTTEVYTMGVDWYQVNGILSIKGEEQKVKLFATGIRDPKASKANSIVLEGQFNLMDWGIDYDKIVNGKSDPVPTKWMYLNMRFGIC